MHNKFQSTIGHVFADQDLLASALTHASSGKASNYERLEFLGDRVLGLAVADELYKKFPDEAEGDLARRLAALVQGTMLAEIAREIDLGAYITFSDAEALAGGADNDNILADVMESVIGALYLDAGFEKAQSLIARLWQGRLDQIKKPPPHPKTALQEWAQSRGLPLPEYEITNQSGPDHAPVFEISVSVEGYPPAVAAGPSRQEAEKQAAAAFMERLTS